MLQRQIMFKQLQELQRRQQLQDLGGNPNYVNQLSSLKQTSVGQLPASGNGISPHDPSQMFMINNSQMMGSNNVQSLPSGLFLGGLPHQQFDISQFSHVQEPSNLSTDLLTKNSNSPLGMQYPAFDNSYMSQLNHVLPDKNSFGQVPVHSLNGTMLSGRNEGGVWHGNSPGKISDASLDPLEQKILYSTDDWVSPFGKSGETERGLFEGTVENTDKMAASIQSGSWSALMQSAVAETSSSDTGIQEEWSGLSFQNPDPSPDNPPSNFIAESEKPQNSSWVDRNLQNSSKPENLFQKPDINCGFPGFQVSGHHFMKSKEEFQSELSHVSTQHSPRNDAPQKLSVGGSQLIQASSPSRGIWPPAQQNHHLKNDVYQSGNVSSNTNNQSHNNFSGHDLRGNFWLHGNTSHQAAVGSQKPFDQMNQLNIQRYSVESEKMSPGNNAEPMPALSGASSELHIQNITVQSESMFKTFHSNHTPGMQVNSKILTPNEHTGTSVASFANPSNNHPMSQGFGFRAGPTDSRIPQSYPFFPSGKSSALSLPSHHSVNDYTKPANIAPHLRNQTSVKFPPYGASSPQDMSSPKPYKFSNNIFRPPDSTSSSLDTSSGAPPEDGTSPHEGSTEINNSTPLTINSQHPEPDAIASSPLMTLTHQQPSNQGFSGSQTSSQSLSQNYSKISAESDYGKRLSVKYDGVNYHQAIANARELFLSGQNSGPGINTKNDLDVIPERAPSISASDNRGQNVISNHSVGSNETSNVISQQQISMQMAPSWFKHYGTLKNGKMLQMYNNTRAVAGAAQPFSEMSLGNMQQLIMQAKLSAAAGQGSSSLQSSAAASLLASKDVLAPGSLPLDVNYQTLAVSLPKKRKMVEFEIVSWNKEISSKPMRIQNISLAELEWAQASNRRLEEVKGDGEIVEDVLFPVVRAKRRLVFTSQLMQQVFRPPAAVILRADASSNCGYVPYSAARLVLGDACRLNSQLPSDTDEMSPDKPRTSKGKSGISDISKVVEGLVSRVKNLENELSRLDKSFSIVDIRVAMQELEKFSMINRFAKFHIKAHPSTIDTSSGPSTVPKPSPQRYVLAFPMPNTLPEGIDCLSL